MMLLEIPKFFFDFSLFRRQITKLTVTRLLLFCSKMASSPKSILTSRQIVSMLRVIFCLLSSQRWLKMDIQTISCAFYKPQNQITIRINYYMMLILPEKKGFLSFQAN